MTEQTASAAAPFKSILLLIADDLGKNLGCYGVNMITPNIDNNSRSVIYTGLHTHQSGQYGLAGKAHHFVIFDNVKTSPAFFREQGYLTGIIGEVHVGPNSSYPWDVRNESTTRDVAWVADQAGEFFDRAKSAEKPLFLAVGYIDPHRDMTRSGFGNSDVFDARIKDIPYEPSGVKVWIVMKTSSG